jgi:DNA-binding LacI/PurR family transcriptional regulator
VHRIQDERFDAANNGICVDIVPQGDGVESVIVWLMDSPLQSCREWRITRHSFCKLVWALGLANKLVSNESEALALIGSDRGINMDKNSSSPPTMRDIAARCGLAVSTVSGALNDSHLVNVETKSRVRRVAEEMGYVKNPLIGTLMRQVRKRKIQRYHETIAYLTAFETPEGWRQRHFFVQLFESVKREVNRNGYEMENVWLGQPDITHARLGRILESRGIRGLIVAPLPRSDSIGDFPWARFHAITFGHSLVFPKLNRGVTHSIQAVDIALECLYKLGYRKPLLSIPRLVDEKSAGLFSLGWRYHQSRSLEGCKTSIIQLPYTNRRSFFLEQIAKCRPDVVLAFGLASKEWLESDGYRIPEDIGFVHMDYRDQPTAGINQNWDRIVASVVKLLINQLQGGESPGVPDIPITMMSDCSWVDGPTVQKQRVVSE